MTTEGELAIIDAALAQVKRSRPVTTRCRVCIMAQTHHLVNPIIRRGREKGFAFSIIAMLLNNRFGADTNRLNENGMQVRDHLVGNHDPE